MTVADKPFGGIYSWPYICGEKSQEYITVTVAVLPTTINSASLKGDTSQSAQTKATSGFALWGANGFSFGDILDIINPLQHLPVISTVYRALTGDDLSPASRVLGDTLFGGPIGAATGVANAILEYASGKDLGQHVLAFLHLPTAPEQDAPSMIANADPTHASLPTTAKAEQETAQRNALARATDQRRFLAALDTYAKNSRLLTVPHIHEYRGNQF
jgi:hypothetical protein